MKEKVKDRWLRRVGLHFWDLLWYLGACLRYIGDYFSVGIPMSPSGSECVSMISGCRMISVLRDDYSLLSRLKTSELWRFNYGSVFLTTVDNRSTKTSIDSVSLYPTDCRPTKVNNTKLVFHRLPMRRDTWRDGKDFLHPTLSFLYQKSVMSVTSVVCV